jgi:hypothetical protein
MMDRWERWVVGGLDVWGILGAGGRNKSKQAWLCMNAGGDGTRTSESKS